MRNPIAMTASGGTESGRAGSDGKGGPKPRAPYWHPWTNGNGVSHQKERALTGFEPRGVGGADPQWSNKHEKVPSPAVVTVQPVGWVGDRHENPAPQWIVALPGRWWIESMDGFRIEQRPGEFSLGEDQGCKESAEDRKGHRSGTVGNQPAVLMTVQLHVEPRHEPCSLP